MAESAINEDKLTPGMKFTMGCEGNYSLCEHPHVPSRNSGVTIGFGCDLAARSHREIYRILRKIAGVTEEYSIAFRNASGLRGRQAKLFLKEHGLHDFKLDHEQIDALFQFTYADEKAIAKRIYLKPGCRNAYGWILKWEQLRQAIRDEIVDLKYRGDWIPATRKFLADPIRSNNLEVFAGAMSKQFFWRVRRRVPKDRFQRRIAYLEKS